MPCFSSTLPQPFRQTKIDRLLLKKKKMIGGTLTSSSSSSTKLIIDDSPTWILRRGGAGAEIFPCVVVPRKTFLRLDSSVHSKILKPMIPLRVSSSEEVTNSTFQAVSVLVCYVLSANHLFFRNMYFSQSILFFFPRTVCLANPLKVSSVI